MWMFARAFALLLFAASAVSCAGSPAMLSRMNSSEIRNIDDSDLCRAYAFSKAEKEVPSVIEAEVARRGLSCAAELEKRVSDCSALRILSAKAYRDLVWMGVSGMAEEALCVVRGDGIERRPERLMEGVGGAGCDLAQPPLHLGPGRLDRVEIGRSLHARYADVTVVTVRNSSEKSKSFRINMGNISSETFRLAPGATQTYGVVVSKETAAVAGVVSALQETTNQTPELYNCVTAAR